MADTTGQWHALIGCYGRHRRALEAIFGDGFELLCPGTAARPPVLLVALFDQEGEDDGSGGIGGVDAGLRPLLMASTVLGLLFISSSYPPFLLTRTLLFY